MQVYKILIKSSLCVMYCPDISFILCIIQWEISKKLLKNLLLYNRKGESAVEVMFRSEKNL